MRIRMSEDFKASYKQLKKRHKSLEASYIRLLMRMDFATMHLFRMSRTERNRVLEILLTYYRLHLPDFPELRSTAVLHTLFL